METVIEKRHKKFRARIKAHFAKKRAAAAPKKSAPTPTHKASPASTAGKTISYAKGKSTVIDLGHKPSKAAITGAVAKLRKATVATTPKATPNSASKAPELKIPAAAKADGSTQVLGRKAQFVAAGVAAAATAGAVLAGSVTKLSTPKAPAPKAPTGELAIRKGELAIRKGELAIQKPTTVKPVATKKATLTARHDARRAKQGTGIRHAREAFERADTRKASDLSARHDARRAKQGTSLRHAFEGAERADARAAAKVPAERRSPANVTRRLEFDAAVKTQTAKNDAAAARVAAPKQSITGSGPGKQRNEVKKAKFKASQPGRVIEATGAGFYDEAGLKKVDERRATERRQGEATRRGKDRQTKVGATTESRARPIANQRGNRRKPSSDPRQGADAPKPKTNAQLQAEINVVKGDIAAKKAKIAQPAHTETIAKLVAPKSAAPKIPTSPKKPEVPKPTMPKVTKVEAQQQYKELKLEAPRTVSEKQKRAADRKFFNQRSAKISEIVNPTKPSNVPGRVQATAADKGSKNEIQRRQNLKRIGEIQVELAPKGAQKGPTPKLKSTIDRANAAERFGATEKQIKDVARKIESVKPSEAGKASFESQVKASTDPEVKRIAKEIARVEAELKTPEAKTPKSGEQLPRSQPKTRVIPSVSDMKLEQEAATVKSPAPTPKATKAQATAVKTPQTTMEGIAQSFKNYAARVATGATVLTNPAIGASVKSKIKAGVKGGVKGGAVLTALFAGLGGVEAGAKENDPGKRVQTGLNVAKKSAKEVALDVGAYTGAAKIAALAGGSASSALFFGAVLPAVGTYKIAKDFTIPNLKELGTQIGEIKYAKNAARLEKKGSEKKYGTIEAATKTRHAKEAVKKAKTKNKSKDLLTG